jgi:hypothetical protein
MLHRWDQEGRLVPDARTIVWGAGTLTAGLTLSFPSTAFREMFGVGVIDIFALIS